MTPKLLALYKKMYQPQAPCVPLDLIAEIERLQAENKRLLEVIRLQAAGQPENERVRKP